MRLIVVSRPDFFEEEIPVLKALFRAGMECLHLRKPTASRAELVNFLGQLPDAMRRRIVIHSHATLVGPWGLKGWHITGRDKKNFSPEQALHVNGISCHSMAEVDRLSDAYNTVFLSPVFASISKLNYPQGFMHDTLQTWLTNHPRQKQIVALGGVSSAQLPLLKAMGFTGVAVLGAVWLPGDQSGSAALSAFQQLLDARNQITQERSFR